MPTLELLKALADETRLRIVSILEQADELCACEIEAVLDLNQSNASRHLARLRSARIVEASRRGHWVHYTLVRSPQQAPLIASLLESVREESDLFRADFVRLRDYRSSGFTCETIGEWSSRTRPAGSQT